MIELHPEILKKNGKEEFVVLPYEEFVAIKEMLLDAEDLIDLRAAKREDSDKSGVGLEEAKKNLL
jgi:hypothetical protein